jgi:hypothetical protein
MIKTGVKQRSWTNLSIANANNAERCIGVLNAEYAGRLFKIYAQVDLIYRTCYQRLFENKKKAEIELSSGDENEEIDVKPKLEEMEPCCSSSLKD